MDNIQFILNGMMREALSPQTAAANATSATSTMLSLP